MVKLCRNDKPCIKKMHKNDMRLLLIEDEEKLAKGIKKGLERQGFAVDCLFDGDAGMERIALYSNDYDLIVLDLMLPGKDGLAICKETRALGIAIPILVLTAREATDDKVTLLNAGADDYMVKPFSFDELVARIRTLLRRPDQSLPPEIKVQNISLDQSAHRVTKNGKPVTLTLREYSLLEYLMRNKNLVVNREQIQNHVWDFADNSLSNVIDVHIKNLRKKLDHGNRGRTLLETVRGVGYKINA